MGLKSGLRDLGEYFGRRPTDYYHSRPEVAYDPNDPLPYYLDQRQRADYDGPTDDDNVPLYAAGGNLTRLPVHITLWALGQLEHYRRDGQQDRLEKCRPALDWLVKSQTDDGAWLSEVPMKRYRLEGSWRSAMAQGLAISTLLRAAHLRAGDRDYYVASAIKALGPFHKDVAHGGVTTYHEAGPFYEEYPCRPSCHVLNGFIFALWGLYDLVRFENNDEARLLWKNGLETLRAWLPQYDLGYWSLYQLPRKPRNPATVPYHELHVKQLAVMFQITGEPIFGEYSHKWESYLGHRYNALHTLPAKLVWLAGLDRTPKE